jgi:hypothetical protein
MSLLSRRSAARVGVLAVAVAAAGLFATPAFADTTADLDINVSGTTVVVGVPDKAATLSILNHGPSPASGIVVTFDLSALDTSKVGFPLTSVCTDIGSSKIECSLEGAPEIPSGADWDLAFPLTRLAGTGSAGQLTVSVAHAGTDPVEGNNSETVGVAVGSSGVDLTVFAPDVYQVDDEGNTTETPVVPGGETLVWVLVGNQGDLAANGINLKITLPDHVTFTEPEPDCTHAAGDSTTECTYDTVVLIPAAEDDEDGEASSSWFFFPVKIADDTPDPSALTGGVATAEAMSIVAPEVPAARAAPAPPAANETDDGPIESKDVDATDNTDEFTVFVAKPSGGGGSLPITGVQAGLIGGAGLVAIVTGGVLFALARRRRVVLVSPTE